MQWFCRSHVDIVEILPDPHVKSTWLHHSYSVDPGGLSENAILP